MTNMYDKNGLLKSVVNIAKQAGEKVMEVYEGGFAVDFKNDLSPITKADTAAHNLILEKLIELTPTISIISEEGKIIKANQSTFWLVDPLDGTKEFIQRNGEFTINIAYVENNELQLGVVCAPAIEMIYVGLMRYGAFKILKNNKIVPINVAQTNIKGNGKIIILESRNHKNSIYMEQFLSKFSNNKILVVGSSLKFCKVAEGLAHIYPRFGHTMEWDTAAGGFVYTFNGEPLLYKK